MFDFTVSSRRRHLLARSLCWAAAATALVTQHSGDGKANQYFLRGFNLDHGTDFATFVDGMPVNMPSHAHGQGYSDLNWLIPELVDRIATARGRTTRRKATSRRQARHASTCSARCRAASPK